MTRQLVLIGGGHAHMVTLARMQTFTEKGYGVTVIQPSEHHYYSGMGPGMLGGTYRPEEIRFATRRLVEAKGGRFLLGKAYRIDPHRQTVLLEGTDEEVPYDVLSCNAGSYVPWEMSPGEERRVFTAKPIEELLLARQRLIKLTAERKIRVAVIGSGPSAVEIAGNIHQLCREQGRNMAEILLYGGRGFMAGRPPRVGLLVERILRCKGVKIVDHGRVRGIEGGRLVLENGERHEADLIFPAVGVKPSPLFIRSGLPVGPDGGLYVDQYLRTSRYPNIFGGGDCIHFAPQPLDKVGVFAVRQNEVLYRNLMACLEGRQPEKFSPGGDYLLIYNLGDGEGVLSKWRVTFSGRLAFRIKDYIDRRFIRQFQDS